MVVNNFIGIRFAGLTPSEKQTHDALHADFEQKQADFHAARIALQDNEATLRAKYTLSPSTPIAVGDLQVLRDADVASATNRQAEIDASLANATDDERAKYTAWVAAGRPVRTIGVPNVG